MESNRQRIAYGVERIADDEKGRKQASGNQDNTGVRDQDSRESGGKEHWNIEQGTSNVEV